MGQTTARLTTALPRPVPMEPAPSLRIAIPASRAGLRLHGVRSEFLLILGNSEYPGVANGSEYASSEKCPLNVCCSAYGFCGTTADFCGNTTVAEPVCDSSSATKKTIAYYEGWNLERSCDIMAPESIPIGGYTHLNFAFLYIDPDLYTITPMATDQEELYSRVVALKKKKTDLEVWISIGGWAFNDPGSTVNTFSDLAASTSKQKTFFQSLLSFLGEYGFDGVDLDWEYPVASDRGGSDADFDNYVAFLANLRTELDSAGKGYGLIITLPSSYWYLQHFDIVNLAKSVDWFNTMTYDLHGGWDAEDPWIGSIVNAHTNLTEITLAMDLLWRNDIEPSKVAMGLGFYGRSFTLNDTSCVTAGCPFSSTGKAGLCTASAGILSFTEIESILKDSSRGATKVYDSEAAVQIVTFDSNQWVSYDDWESFAVKIDYANSHCIGGTMVWAVTYDSDGTATNGLTGDSTLFPGDDGSNGGEGDIYIGPDLWTNASHEISCNPPCTMVLPPYPLETGVTINWPPITTSFASSSDGQTLTKTTTITVPPFHITAIPFWPITVPGSSVNQAYISPLQSITPPAMVITLPGTEAEFPLYHTNYSALVTPSATTTTTTGNATAIGGATDDSSVVTTPAAIQTGIVSDCTEFYFAVSGDTCAAIAAAYDIALAEFDAWNPAVGADCAGLWAEEYYCVAVATTSATGTGGGSQTTDSGGSSVAGTTASATTLTPVFSSSSHAITVHVQPTASSVNPSPSVPPLTFSVDTPPSNGGCSSGSTLSGCGTHDCSEYGCGGECGFFGCDGGCGLGFCGGGCGLEGCGPGCGDDSCLQTGGGGGQDSEEETSTSSCSAEATPTTTSFCDVSCPEAPGASCVTWCSTMTLDCEPTGVANLLIASMDIDSIDSAIYSADEDTDSSSAWSAASWLNPRYTGWDSITVNGTTLGVSGPAPTMAITSSTASKTTATAVSVTSCGLQTTQTASSTSTYCTCNGGYGVSLSTKTNAAHSTFLICAADPPLTVTTITPTTTSTTQKKTTSTTTTTTAAKSSNTGFAITYIKCSSSTCPVGETCEASGSFDVMGVQPLGDDDDADLVQISGSYNKETLVSGGKAKFCGQTSKFTVSGDTVTGSSSSSKYGTYSCLKYSDATSVVVYDKDNGITCESTPQYACLTEICL
ncbi:glycoside hydrolase [Aspergillus sclerotiicarbonarius CBS 121057]|uniref:chitinase n=1 Tax=Aspergillus sclerotiicarbonarius (strain CBS 121057 / IBT 28362) TaxID=1448318 RepID=A0A319ERJ1_ASPSB|nr:glycoside hydrolase [Aspergillus sclerotiicarbonarius CBS 121057]